MKLMFYQQMNHFDYSLLEILPQQLVACASSVCITSFSQIQFQFNHNIGWECIYTVYMARRCQ